MPGRGHAWLAGGHAWLGGVCGWGVCAWGKGACMACMPPWPDTTRYGRSMSGRYASYWNAFLCTDVFSGLLRVIIFGEPRSMVIIM